MNFRVFVVLLVLVFGACKKSESENKSELIGLVLASQAASVTIDCTTSTNTSPSFAGIVASGKLAPCAACHRGRGPACPDSDLDVYDYVSITAKLTKGKPDSSFLYLTSTQGAMKQYSNSELNQILYDWIKNCAPK